MKVKKKTSKKRTKFDIEKYAKQFDKQIKSMMKAQEEHEKILIGMAMQQYQLMKFPNLSGKSDKPN